MSSVKMTEKSDKTAKNLNKVPYMKHHKTSENGRNVCLLCDPQGREMASNVQNNFRLHFMRVHREKAIEYGMISDSEIPRKKRKVQKIEIEMSKELWIRSCVQIAIKNPFSFFDSEGWQQIAKAIEPKLDITVNRHNITAKIKEYSDKFRNIIKSELKDRFISIKMDGVWKHGRAILGLTCQHINNGKLHIRTLEMIELTNKHTGAYISGRLRKVLERFVFYHK